MTFIKLYNLYIIQATCHNCQIFVKTQVLWKLLHFVYDIFELLSQIIDDSVVFSKTYNFFKVIGISHHFACAMKLLLNSNYIYVDKNDVTNNC
jgi:hypothetical protein